MASFVVLSVSVLIVEGLVHSLFLVLLLFLQVSREAHVERRRRVSAMPRLRCFCYCDSPAPGETLILPLFCGRTPQRRGTRAEMHPRHCCSPGNRTHTAGASVEREA
ncbi:hypothetical protein NDU88_002390 [Pleurodeles waltl]|uniref:Secreted protein n=1 Tax=Pleurodeles waltl TaxID=8319 RepID=A0AAV7TMZ6_PLEWA|nr:hypothetical protein NDU88_002390 [Pleurodeles waltl]